MPVDQTTEEVALEPTVEPVDAVVVDVPAEVVVEDPVVEEPAPAEAAEPITDMKIYLVKKYEDRIPVQITSDAQLEALIAEQGAENVEPA